jgi:hypothetical protein
MPRFFTPTKDTLVRFMFLDELAATIADQLQIQHLVPPICSS